MHSQSSSDGFGLMLDPEVNGKSEVLSERTRTKADEIALGAQSINETKGFRFCLSFTGEGAM